MKLDTNNNLYIFLYASVLAIIVALLLSFASISLKPYQKKNLIIEKKQNILNSINIKSNAKTAEKTYSERIKNSYLVNYLGEKVDGDAFNLDLKKEMAKPLKERKLSVYECILEDGSKKFILPLRGMGLWGPIWGYISLNDDLNEIYGVTFDHASETPGLGAEIATKPFQEQFKGKEIFDETGSLVSILVAKSNEKKTKKHSVDAISGGTITSKALQSMIKSGLQSYENFLTKLINNSN